MVGRDYDGSELTVLFIMGSGRSGSTILDVALGTHQSFVSVGELCNVAKLGWLENEYCACGQRANNCEFWVGVRKRWEYLSGGATAEDLVRVQSVIERQRSLITRYLRPNQWAAELATYHHLLGNLYRAVADMAGKSTIVDSSKNPLRAYAMSSLRHINIKGIHLIRDVRGVANSMHRRFIKNLEAGVQKNINPTPVLWTAMYWIIGNLEAEWVCRILGQNNSTRILYEEFMSSPDKSIGSISAVSNNNLKNISDAIRSGQCIEPGHTIAGNRVRMSGSIKLKIDESWKTALSGRQKALLWLVAGWLLRRYGYSR